MIEKITRVCELLEAEYGKPEWVIHHPPLDEFVLTILSQNTTSVNCRRAFDNLRVTFPTWDDVRTAAVDEIAESIRAGGLADVKAARIKSALQRIYDQRGELDLSWLKSLSMDEAARYLMEFEGVGPKTAACVLLFSLRQPAFPVDTHVHRIALRLGIIPPNTNAETAHVLLQKIVPEQQVYSFHMNMVGHGRRVCRPSSPKCDTCVLNRECDFARKHS